mmetsp:Transcript_10648/g.9372  ORF Transcript_10648/g.9372 Transcript_10648/m.9372 type:complete len:129 (+) Transcript_10648:374-760(+)
MKMNVNKVKTSITSLRPKYTIEYLFQTKLIRVLNTRGGYTIRRRRIRWRRSEYSFVPEIMFNLIVVLMNTFNQRTNRVHIDEVPAKEFKDKEEINKYLIITLDKLKGHKIVELRGDGEVDNDEVCTKI